MPKWLPWALLVVVALLVAIMPWRRPHPNHEFMLRQWSRLSEDTSAEPAADGSKEKVDSGFIATAGRPDGNRSAHI